MTGPYVECSNYVEGTRAEGGNNSHLT